ncbi:MAG: hypothetical protein L6R37_007572 [Teloschistes peruensis]|nr:MAG: hypothetical protein L6R37_007572 [Teloschistes peruensis]
MSITSSDGYDDIKGRPEKWSLGVLNDKETDEVPGSVLLMSNAKRNEPLGLRNAPARTSASSLPSPYPPEMRSRRVSEHTIEEKKKTKDGTMILDPQPDDSMNDPLNWPTLRRDAALLSLGFYCMLGGGMTPVLAAGFNDVAETYNVSVPQVALTTGLYMMGLGLGCVVTSPTAILFGKRPVYLVCIVLIVAIVVGFCFFLMFFFVPETFWDRTPQPQHKSHKPKSTLKSISGFFHHPHHDRKNKSSTVGHGVADTPQVMVTEPTASIQATNTTIAKRRRQRGTHHVGFADAITIEDEETETATPDRSMSSRNRSPPRLQLEKVNAMDGVDEDRKPTPYPRPPVDLSPNEDLEAKIEHQEPTSAVLPPDSAMTVPVTAGLSEKAPSPTPAAHRYTTYLRTQPPKTFAQTLKPWNGQLRHENWFLVALRPFVLFAYPAILWSALVYSLSIGWLIVLSESVSTIYRSDDYHFSAMGVGLVYISPFIGGILGTAVAGKVSDVIVKAMSRKNGGVYEPEFRLVMAIPVAIATCIGLMGFGWSAEEKDNWIVPTVFFGVISFGSSLGSTTSITFAVDSYRMYAGEGLVTLNFAKNIFHGLVFSLFFNHWLEDDGSKKVFLAIGGIQLAFLLTTIPMYIYGKRARMWTYRKNLMEKF